MLVYNNLYNILLAITRFEMNLSTGGTEVRLHNFAGALRFDTNYCKQLAVRDAKDGT